MSLSCVTPHPALPLKGGGTSFARVIPSPLEGEGRVGGMAQDSVATA
jgi:hypothetical protein